MERTVGRLTGNLVSGRLESWGCFPWIMLAGPHIFYHFRLRDTAASFLIPFLIRSHQDATYHVPRAGSFVEPEMLIITTDAATQAAEHPRTDRRTAPHTYTRSYLLKVNTAS